MFGIDRPQTMISHEILHGVFGMFDINISSAALLLIFILQLFT